MLVGVVAADHPFAGERIVGRADARQQQQPHVAEAIGAQNHDAGRLLDLVAAGVDVGDAGGLLAGRIRVDAQHVAQRAQLEGRLPGERGVHRGQGIGLGALRADMARAEAAERAFEHLHAVEVAVVLGHRRGRALERHVTQRARRLGEQGALIRAPRRRVRILARARPFVRIAAGLDLALQVAGLAADAEDFLELVVVGLDIVPGDAPVLQIAVLRNERGAIALLDARAHLEIMRQKAARVAAPVRRRAADHLARLERAHLAHRQRRLRVVVAKRKGVARQVLEDVAMTIELQFVVHVGFLKIGVDIELLAALQAHDAQPGAGQFHGHDRAHDATAHDDDIDGFQFRGRHLSIPRCCCA